MLPLLGGVSGIINSLFSNIMFRVSRGGKTTYPRQPGTTLGPKSKIPGGLESLEVLIGLEEGCDPIGIDEADNENGAEEAYAVGG